MLKYILVIEKVNKSLYLVLFDEQLYSGEVFSMVCGGCQGHPLFDPQLMNE